MNIEILQALYVNNLARIFIPGNFKELASHSNNIQGYSFMNRVLIYMQNKFCTEVKSEMSWKLDGREVNNEAIPMGIITPITKIKYIDTSTGKEVKVSELNETEFNKAIMLGIINKEISIVDIKCTLVYDIRDTYIIDKAIEKRKDKKIKLSSLFELLTSIGVSVERTEAIDTTYDNSNSTLYIGEDGLFDKIEKCIDTLVIKYIEQCEEGIDLTDLEKRLVREYGVYSVLSYFNIESNIDFNYITQLYENNTDNYDNRFEKIIEILDDIEHMLNSNVLSSEDPSGYALDEGHKTYIAHKAAILLNILEANYEVNGIKGV